MTTPAERPALPEPYTTVLGDEYEAFNNEGRPMGKAYEQVPLFGAKQMHAYYDAGIAPLRAEIERLQSLNDVHVQALIELTDSNNLFARRIKELEAALRGDVLPTHQCVRCDFFYTPSGENEDCPRCGCDGTYAAPTGSAPHGGQAA